MQLHGDFDFAAASEVAGYLKALGISHVYTSPLLQASPGSTHGYDIVDHSRAGDELGGEAGRRAFAARLRELGLGCVVDMVPNHMSVAVPALNKWWWDVLEHGPAAEHAAYFDIDWSIGRLLLPVLSDEPDALGKLRLIDRQLDYDGLRFPLAPGTESGSPIEVHDRQHYELASWRRSGELNYRRFFDVTELAAIRVEDQRVFDDAHGELLRWVAASDVDGLRIDHPDGLADPGGYLDRLAEAAPDAWVVVEKILAADEDLPPTWRCAGTTGYDALRVINGVLRRPSWRRAADSALRRAHRINHRLREADIQVQAQRGRSDTARRDNAAGSTAPPHTARVRRVVRGDGPPPRLPHLSARLRSGPIWHPR